MRLWAKLAMVGLLTLAILIPLSMIRGVIAERQQYRAQAVADIARSVGGTQTLAGPVLLLPYSEWVDESYVEKESGLPRSVRKRVQRTWTVFPDRLRAEGTLSPQVRRRGLHAVRTYQWQGAMKARFDVALPPADATERDYGKPVLAWAVADVRGLRGTPRLVVDGRALDLQQGSGIDGRPGMHVELARPQAGARLALETRLELALAGTETFAVLPLARSNDIVLRSSWPHPKFEGMAPQHEIRATGFKARWQVDALATDARQRWQQGNWQARSNAGPVPVVAAAGATPGDAAQVSLLDPVNPYVQADRATKYGLLFVLLTFGGFFLFEMLKQVRVHPIQYALVGLAIAIFFLLLVSLSEHVAFGIAYLAAALACIGLIGFYLAAVLQGFGRAAGFCAMLALLYAVLYGLLLSEDNALALGAGLLFVVLAAVMAATRKLDWYALSGEGVPAFLRRAVPGSASTP